MLLPSSVIALCSRERAAARVSPRWARKIIGRVCCLASFIVRQKWNEVQEGLILVRVGCMVACLTRGSPVLHSRFFSSDFLGEVSSFLNGLCTLE